MLEIFDFYFKPGADMTVEVVAVRMIGAALFGVIVCLIYFTSFGRKKSDALPFGVTLILLSILVAMTTSIIGNNQALAFSLVGTLAIVRFRTTMDDTRDTAFVIFAVAVGMGSAVGAIKVVLVGIPIVAVVVFLTTWIAKRLPQPGPERMVIVRSSSATPSDQKAIANVLNKSTTRHQLMGVESGKAGEAIDHHYLVRMKEADWLHVVSELRSVAGVLNVEVKGK